MNRKRPPIILDRDDPLALEIQAVLEEDLVAGARLMQPAYRKHALATHTLDGYCAAATAAYFHLSGGRKKELQPMQHTDRRGNSHWWICKNDDRIVDLVYRRDEASTYHHYRRGVPRGFTNCGYDRVPKRAQEIIDRVVARRDDYDSEVSERVRSGGASASSEQPRRSAPGSVRFDDRK